MLVCWGYELVELPDGGIVRDGVTVIDGRSGDTAIDRLAARPAVFDPFTVECVAHRLAAFVEQRERAGVALPS